MDDVLILPEPTPGSSPSWFGFAITVRPEAPYGRAELVSHLEAGGIAACFRATASSEEVAAGKPAPDVYLEVARRLGIDPHECTAVEDSHNGIRSAKAAGMRCVAIPNAHFPPGDAVAEADALVASLAELTPQVLVA